MAHLGQAQCAGLRPTESGACHLSTVGTALPATRRLCLSGHATCTHLPPLPSFIVAADYQSWEKVDPATLFDAPTLKSEANPKARVCRHLQQEAKGCDYLVGGAGWEGWGRGSRAA